MANAWLTNQFLQAQQRVKQFFLNLKQVTQALGLWSGVFVIAQIVLGFLPMVMALTLGLTVDAMIGARGIGVMTSDLNAQLMRWVLMLVIGFAAYFFTLRFSGKAAEVGHALRDIVLFSALLVFFVGSQQILLAAVYLLMLALDYVFGDDRRIRFASLAVIVIVGMMIAHTLIRFTILRSYTVGEGLGIVTAIVTFMVFFKFRLIRD